MAPQQEVHGRRLPGAPVVLALATIVTLHTAATVAAASTYTTIPLGANAVATDVSNVPQVVGCVLDVGRTECEAVVWDFAGTHRLGITVDPGLGLHINDGGIVAGFRVVDGARRLFAWVNGAVIDLPPPPGDVPQLVKSLTNTNVLLVQGQRSSWRFMNGVWTDLTAETGAEIAAMNDAGALGGTSSGGPYLRAADGVASIPWSGPGGVRLVGPAGHFTSGALGAGAVAYWWFGEPDGTVTRVTEISLWLRYYVPNDVNAAGDVVGSGSWRQMNPMEPWYSVGFIRRNGRTEWLPALEQAVAINDSGYIVGMAAGGAVVLVPVLPGPTGLAFTVVDRVVTLSWEPVPGALDYIVEAGSSPGASDLYRASIGAQPGLVTPAPPGRYYVRVIARTAAGLTGASEEVVIEVR